MHGTFCSAERSSTVIGKEGGGLYLGGDIRRLINRDVSSLGAAHHKNSALFSLPIDCVAYFRLVVY